MSPGGWIPEPHRSHSRPTAAATTTTVVSHYIVITLLKLEAGRRSIWQNLGLKTSRHLFSAKFFRRARLSWASPWAFRLGLWMMQDHWSGDGQFIDALNLQNKRFTVSFRVCKARWSGVAVVVSSLISLCVLLTPPLPRAASWDLVTTMQLLAAGFIHCYYGFNRGAG